MSTIRTRLFLACESFLRVPPLLIVDEIFRTSFGLGGRFFKHNPHEVDPVAQTVIIDSKDASDFFEGARFLHGNETLDNNSYLTESLQSDVEASVNSSTDSSWSSLFVYVLNEWLVGGEEFLKNQTSHLVEVTSETLKSVVENKSTNLLQLGSAEEFSNVTEEFAEDLMKCGEVLSCVVLFLTAVVMFMLATENLIKLYSYLLSFLTLYIAYIATPISTVSAWSLSSLPFMFLNFGFRTVLAAVFFASRSWPRGYPIREDRTSVASLIDPLLFSMFYISGVVSFSPVIYILIVTALHHSLIVSLPKVYNFLVMSWGETKRIQNEYGLSHLIQVESGRLRINTVFRLFWMTRAAYDAFYRCCDEPISLIIRYVMTHGTETFTGIVGLTVTVAAICHQIGDFLLWILYFGANSEVDANRFGSISTVLFFILSLQTGLTSLDPEKRLDRLMKNIVLLGTALFHALHQMVSPLLHAFRSFQAVQIRAASISCTFLCVSVFLTVYLLRWTTISTWSLAVLALAIEFKIKVIISLIISLVVYLSQLVQYPEVVEKFVLCCRRVLPNFCMRFFDQLYDQISHEDMVFYLKTIANVAEFITGIFLFVNAVWIFLFESTSAIRAIGMSIHAYFNIWCEAQKGFRIYCQRKTAAKKIMSLSDATDEQLRSRNDDVCSICYEGLESAKVTNCGHYFHAVCLRKWLYVQNTCPMCHEILYREEIVDEIEQGPHEPEVEPLPQPPPNSPNDTALPGARNENGLSDSDNEELIDDNNRGGPLPEPNLPQAAGVQRDGNGNNLQRQPVGTYEGIRFYGVADLGNESDGDDNTSSEGEFNVNEIAADFQLQDLVDVETDEEDEEAEEGGRQAHSRGLVVFL